MAKAKTDLVIVESPAKARTIEKYLGNHYQVVASMGHLRDLPKSTMGVDIDGDFTPQYLPVKDRADVIADLKKRAKSADTVYLATDPDREGEAISWHLKELLDLPDDKAKRVTFNEITKKVVTESIQHPREIDQDLVDAQQARRILDRIVGYKLSPLLWRKVKPGLSAGRVQSVATRIVVDRENEIRAFQPQEYWLLDALLVGIGQAIALCPGISRSGMTITAGCFTGFERKFAVRFAFLLSIPAVLGANILTLKDAIDTGIDFSSVPVYLVGVVVAAVSGYASIRLLRYVADKGRFGAFAYYCWAAGVLTLVLTILH
jgi:hypothetical protein